MEISSEIKVGDQVKYTYPDGVYRVGEYRGIQEFSETHKSHLVLIGNRLYFVHDTCKIEKYNGYNGRRRERNQNIKS